MKCRKCKNEIPNESRYCMLCGADQQPPARKPKGRGNGQGSVYKEGKTYTAVSQTCKPERHRVVRKGFRTRAEALAALPTMYAELLGARAKKKGIVTLASLYAGWSSSVAEKLSESKKTAYKIAYKRISDIAEAPVSELVIDDLQACVSGLTYYPARDIKTLLSHLYKRACAQQDAGANLAAFIVLPALNEKEAEAFTEDELKKLWNVWNQDDPFVGFILLMVYTGMMPGEVLGCAKEMVDLKSQKIVGAGLKTEERKKKPIMIPGFLMPVVRKLCDTPNKMLVGMSRDAWYSEYHATLSRAGVRDLPPYSCRHTTATALAIGDKVAPVLITKIMRQKRAETTERYKHADEQQILAALDQLKSDQISND